MCWAVQAAAETELYKCCDKVFTTRASYARHRRKTHNSTMRVFPAHNSATWAKEPVNPQSLNGSVRWGQKAVEAWRAHAKRDLLSAGCVFVTSMSDSRTKYRWADELITHLDYYCQGQVPRTKWVEPTVAWDTYSQAAASARTSIEWLDDPTHGPCFKAVEQVTVQLENCI